MLEYKILQLNINDEEASMIMFSGYDFIVKKYSKLEDLLKLYKEVYSGNISADAVTKFTILEELFRKFNIDHPEDFKGHSLSVSDIVYFPADEEYWLCDSYGWKLLEKTLK